MCMVIVLRVRDEEATRRRRESSPRSRTRSDGHHLESSPNPACLRKRAGKRNVLSRQGKRLELVEPQSDAEGAGFEPARPRGLPVFKTGGFVRSPTPPRRHCTRG